MSGGFFSISRKHMKHLHSNFFKNSHNPVFEMKCVVNQNTVSYYIISIVRLQLRTWGSLFKEISNFRSMNEAWYWAGYYEPLINFPSVHAYTNFMFLSSPAKRMNLFVVKNMQTTYNTM